MAITKTRILAIIAEARVAINTATQLRAAIQDLYDKTQSPTLAHILASYHPPKTTLIDAELQHFTANAKRLEKERIRQAHKRQAQQRQSDYPHYEPSDDPNDLALEHALEQIDKLRNGATNTDSAPNSDPNSNPNPTAD